MTEPPTPARGRPNVEPLPPGMTGALRDPRAYPADATARHGIAVAQTHISYVFLTGRRVYKLRKAIRPGFLDFGTREARNADCIRELELNRRLAPDVYLGIAPVHFDAAGARVGPISQRVADPALEHCVVMRRLPRGRDALSLLDQGMLGRHHLDRIAQAVTAFHTTHALPRPAPFTPRQWIDAITTPVEDNIATMGDAVPRDRVAALASAARAFVRRHGDRFERRRQAGAAVDGHGDLHLAHIWFESDDSEPLFVDCIEFSDRLRRIDRASEIAFLTMDLRYRGRSDFGEYVLREYAALSDDFALYSVVDYFLSYRAAVRAKVAAMAMREGEIPAAQRHSAEQSARRHLELAIEALAHQSHGAIVMMAGVVGTGKSTAARAVADTLEHAAIVRSDRVRKHLAGRRAGTEPTVDQAHSDQDLYSAAFTEHVYTALIERAQPICASGRVTILDATYAQRRHRDAIGELARQLDVPLLVVETRCPDPIARARLAQRRRNGGDPSDAGPEFHAESVARFTPITEVTPDAHIVLHTSEEGWRATLSQHLSAWAGRPA